MAKKDSVFDTLMTYLNSQKTDRVLRGGRSRVDDLALAKVRFIEDVLRKSELSATEKERASKALHSAYDAVDPAYSGVKLYLSDFGREISQETNELLHKIPSIPNATPILHFGNSDADAQLAKVSEKLKSRRERVKSRS